MTIDKTDAAVGATAKLNAAIAAMLAERGLQGISEDDSLFLSGRLDSLAAAEILGMLEADFGLDMSDLNFDITEIDTLARLAAMVRRLQT